MAKSVLNAKHFHDEEAAYAWVEARVWPNGPVCPHCNAGADKVRKMGGKSTRIGTYKCYGCRKPLTVKVGTIFESSHVALHLWLQAMFLIASSKKGISANQLHRTLGVTLKTAWFMGHRIREAMRSKGLTPLGGSGKIVESDETFFQRKPGFKKRRGYGHKVAILSLVERGGDVRSMVVEAVNRPDLEKIIRANIDRESRLMTDTAPYYKRPMPFASHETVNHKADEYVRGDVHTNTLEGFFSIFKRGMRGTYQHCSPKHVHRYLAEFDFRYNNRVAMGVNDEARAERLVSGIVGKRLTYRDSSAVRP